MSLSKLIRFGAESATNAVVPIHKTATEIRVMDRLSSMQFAMIYPLYWLEGITSIGKRTAFHNTAARDGCNSTRAR
jgi:hypothetical protein